MVSPPRAHQSTRPTNEFQDPLLDDSYDGHPILQSWREATPFLADMAPLMVIGLGVLLLGTFLQQLWLTTAADGLATTASWLTWAGRAAIAGALIVASLRPSPATPAIRVTILAIGIVVALGMVGGLPNLF